MKKIMTLGIVFIISILLSGCMYPNELKVENQVPGLDQLETVQKAINAYKEDTGVLPIKNRDMDTDLYIKYIIDFEKLIPKYLSAAPANAYEKGGLFQYVIWDAENNPTVKLIDLRMPDKIRDVKARTMVKKYPEYGERVADNVYTINYKKLGFANPITVDSPYTNNELPLVYSNTGEVYIDYSADLNWLLQEKSLKPKQGEDIRNLLIEHFPVLPAYSLVYTVNEKNEVSFLFE